MRWMDRDKKRQAADWDRACAEHQGRMEITVITDDAIEVRVGDHVAYGWYDETGMGGLSHAPTQASMDAVGAAIDALTPEEWAERLRAKRLRQVR